MIIENKTELRHYLTSKRLIALDDSFSMKVLNGGVSSRAVWVERKGRPLVLKQSLRKLKTAADWYSDPNRIKIEAVGLKWMYQNLDKGAVPEPVFFDDEHLVLAMEGIQEPHQNFKEILLRNELPMPLIKRMGALLGRIHAIGSQDETAKKQFADRSYFINLRIEPYYEYSKARLPETEFFYDQLIKDTLDTVATVVHGDFSPKNILVKNNNLILLDFEVMHFGDPAFDLGFAITHFLSKANYLDNVQFVEAALVFWESYQQCFKSMESCLEERIVRHVLGCMIARVHGRSPLEYLADSQQSWQSATTLKLISTRHDSLADLFEEYKYELNER